MKHWSIVFSLNGVRAESPGFMNKETATIAMQRLYDAGARHIRLQEHTKTVVQIDYKE